MNFLPIGPIGTRHRPGLLQVVGQLTALTLLEVGANSVSDPSPLQGLTGLCELWLGGNRIADTTWLAGWAPPCAMPVARGSRARCWTGLQRPGGRPVKHMEWAVQRLRSAWLTHTCACPARFDSLRSLDLQSNRLASVEHLSSCTALEELCLSHNGLSDVQARPVPAAGGCDLSSCVLRE